MARSPTAVTQITKTNRHSMSKQTQQLPIRIIILLYSSKKIHNP